MASVSRSAREGTASPVRERCSVVLEKGSANVCVKSGTPSR